MDNKETAVHTEDAFSNPAFRLGFGTQSPLEGTQYPLTRMTENYTLLGSLYRSNWIVQNIITTIPTDMVKKGFALTDVTDPMRLSRLARVQRETGVRRALLSGLNWGRLYGGAIGVILLRGHEDRLEEPLCYDEILPDSFCGLHIVDRWSGVQPDSETVRDMTDQDFGLPLFYEVRTPDESVRKRVHHSRVVRFIGRELPTEERIAENYWGASELEALYDEVVKRDNVSHNMAALTFRACRDYMEMEGADQLFALGGAEQQRRFWSMMQAQSALDSNFGLRVVNKGDVLHNTQYSFAGLSDVYENIMMDVAGASHIPVTKLFGRAPGGLNATGESDLRNYYDYVDSQRESVLRDILERLLPVLCLSAWGTLPEALEFTFPPLWEPHADELAEIARKKTDAVLAVYKAGLIDARTARRELKGLAPQIGLFGGISELENEIKMEGDHTC